MTTGSNALWRNMKYMSIDYGQKRTGIAVSDSGGRMAFPRPMLAMRGKDLFFSELLELAKAEEIQVFVLGLPLRQNGEDSESTRQARNMAARLRRRSPLPIYFMPETLSSFAAEELLREAGNSGKKLKEKLDSAAAVAILESFLALPEDKRMHAF